MSFSWFRKHQTLFLWGTVIFCVLIFATFSGFSDLQALVQGSGSVDTIGRFTTATSNEVIEIGQREFIRTRNAMNRYRAISGNAEGGVDDDMVWQFLILREDARGADVVVSDGEVAGFLQAFMGPNASKQFYQRLWRDFMQFASARECEQFFHDMMLGGRWADFQMQAARIVNADEVYTRWASDNMRFDLDAVVIPDTPIDEIPDPPRDELQAWFDEQPEAVRNYRYADPKKHDIVFAWLPLDAAADATLDEALAATGELGDPEVQSRFNLLKPTLWPDAEEMDAEEMDDAMRAVVERQLRVIRYVQQTRDAFDLLEETGDEAFRSHMTAAGLTLAETDAPLDAEGLKVLDPIGDEALPLWLDQLGEGQTHFGYPYRDQTTAYAVYIRGVVPSRPLSFDEGYDKILESWKEGERNKVALDWREAITEQTRALPEAIAITQPILDAVEVDVAAALAEQPDLDEEGRAALRDELMTVAEQDIDVRVAEFEHLAWAATEPPAGATRLALNGVPRGYGRMLDGDEDPDGIERFLKINTSIYRLGVNAVSQTLRHPATNETAIVRVVATSLPSEDEMWADEAGMEQSRQVLAQQRQISAQDAFEADVIAASHGLELVVFEEEGTEEQPSPE